MGKRKRNNRTAGHSYEVELAKRLRNILGMSDVVTCRACNRMRDGQGIDFTHANESKFGRMFMDVQAKKAKSVSLIEVLQRIEKDPARIRVIFWNKTAPDEKGTRIVSKGEYVFLTSEDFFKLAQAYMKQHGLDKIYQTDDNAD